mgnify:CR=1 FL=1
MSREIGTVVWFVGLSGSGKTTISRLVEKELDRRGVLRAVLDGDELRQAISPDLGFGYEDRMSHIRRTPYMAGWLSRNGFVVLAPLIPPYREMREMCRELLPSFREVYVKCPIGECIARDVKGLYRKALAGEIPEFTGISDRFDEPESSDLILETDRESPEESARKVCDLLRDVGEKVRD